MKTKFIAAIFLLALAGSKLIAQNDTGIIVQPDPYVMIVTDTIPVDTAYAVQGETTDTPVETEPPKLTLNGYIQTDDRLKFEGAKLNFQEYRLDLKLEYKPFERARFFADVWLRSFKYPELSTISDLSDKKKLLNFDADLREAYFDIYGLFTKNLDIRIGRQRIAWGTADKFNPTDNLNAYDMEDLWDFGRHLGSNAIKLTYYTKSFTFTGVVIPWFTPSVLPNGEWTPAFMPNALVPGLIYDSSTIPGLTIPVYLTKGNVSDTLAMPQRDLKHYSSFGLKVKKTFGNWDVSLSYIYGRDALPLPVQMNTNLVLDTLIMMPSLKAEATVDVRTRVEFPVMKMIGLDFAGSIKGVGLWGEGALFLPQKTYMKRYLHYSMPDFGVAKDSVLTDSLVLDNSPYVKFVLGLDYTFSHGFYLNFQYLHGFVNERGPKELNDYFLISLQYTTPNDKLKLSLLSGGLQVADFKHFKENYAWFYAPEVSYKPVDNAEFILGAHLLDGASSTSFGKVNKNDEIYLKLKYSF